jgi:hypothetical protein
MSAVIKCECGWSFQADSREQAAAAMERHVADEHPISLRCPRAPICWRWRRRADLDLGEELAH